MKGAIAQGVRFAVACLLTIAGTSAAGAGDVVIDDSNQTRTHDCGGGNAVVNGGDNALTFKDCRKVVINGGDNQVDAGTASAISVLGSGNRVAWTKVAGGSGPKVVNLGSDNVVSSNATLVVKRKDGDSATDLEGALGVALTQMSHQGKDQVVSVGGDGTVRVEGSGGGAVEVKGGTVSARNAHDIVVRENSRNESLDCAGGKASVDGNNSVLTLRGCGDVTVNGNGNKLEVVGASSLSLYGNSNEIHWAPGSTGAEPKVSDLGRNNVVSRKP